MSRARSIRGRARRAVLQALCVSLASSGAATTSACQRPSTPVSQSPAADDDSEAEAEQSRRAAYVLSADARSVEAEVGVALDDRREARFLSIEVVDVENPELAPVQIEVRYQSPEGGAPRILGTFSLFPPDNPGEFLVATAGGVEEGGTLVLSLVEPPGNELPSSLRVELAELRLEDE